MFCVQLWSGTDAVPKSGAAATVSVKNEALSPPLVSSTYTVIDSSPTSSARGVPLNVRVAPSKLSQSGSGVGGLPDCTAL